MQLKSLFTTLALLSLTPFTLSAPAPIEDRAIAVDPTVVTARAIAADPTVVTARAIAVDPDVVTARAIAVDPTVVTARAVLETAAVEKRQDDGGVRTVKHIARQTVEGGDGGGVGGGNVPSVTQPALGPAVLNPVISPVVVPGPGTSQAVRPWWWNWGW
ncbi:hypothetical protein I302_106067 [Kwoniella bestiolae CBS 10118]|uniref:Uncharacterized protein n=1 Tax=Kwoniella bestiolae CBS 10118 TaxID=1296100 RepID=A0A1B9G2X4_9TREE|nr:hypothetical protein I302_05192 [Kwoniella bestiolae CBS 10118]OCF25373.1 hypothetical protein I302_05192 [Kwoniella bestiolae CBS 10118]